MRPERRPGRARVSGLMTHLLLGLALGALGCSNTKSPTNTPPKSAPAAQGGAEAMADAATADTQPAPSWRWHRAVPREPHPAAKGLYRRLLDRAAAGDVKAAQDLATQIKRRYPDSRFAARLSAPAASSAAVAAALGLLSAAILPVLK